MKTTQKEIADKCCVGQPLISRLSRGKFPRRLRMYLGIFRTMEQCGNGHRLHLLYPDEFDADGNQKQPAQPHDRP